MTADAAPTKMNLATFLWEPDVQNLLLTVGGIVR